jgi:vancomycin resistance protein VanW
MLIFLKRQLRLGLRYARDVRSGNIRKIVRQDPTKTISGSYIITLRQDIRPGETLAQKRANIALACQFIHGITLLPGEIFSFWALVGPPTQRRGFQASRNIVKGQLSTAVGGGLCQVSGILYHLALLSGLGIVERHAHSIDIYTEAERVTPLGADATVVYGYKDLRIKNIHPFPIQLQLILLPHQLEATLCSGKKISTRNLVFQRHAVEGSESVTTMYQAGNGTPQHLVTSVYQKIS